MSTHIQQLLNQLHIYLMFNYLTFIFSMVPSKESPAPLSWWLVWSVAGCFPPLPSARSLMLFWYNFSSPPICLTIGSLSAIFLYYNQCSNYNRPITYWLNFRSHLDFSNCLQLLTGFIDWLLCTTTTVLRSFISDPNGYAINFQIHTSQKSVLL